MAMTLAEIEQEARNLSREDQLRLAAMLTEQNYTARNTEIDKAWVSEAARRLQEIRSGKDELLDLDTVLKEAEHLAVE